MWLSDRRGRPGSVQEQLPLQEIADDVVRLRGGEDRAVLETGSVNFALRSEPEQEAILAGYRRFLNGLAYPLQVLVRVVPTDVERYLAGLRGARRESDMLRRLALDHEAFVRRIARKRTLLDRRFYVVVPAGGDRGTASGGPAWHRMPWRRESQPERRQDDLARSRRTLSFRCAEVMRGLGSFGVPARRLGGDELVALWRDTLAGGVTSSRGEPPRATPVVIARSPGWVAGGA